MGIDKVGIDKVGINPLATSIIINCQRLITSTVLYSSSGHIYIQHCGILLKYSNQVRLVNPRRAYAARVTVLGLCVCMSVCVCLLLNNSLFTWLFVPQRILTFSASDEGRNFKRFTLKMLRCEARAFPVGTARPFFTPRKTRMRTNLDRGVWSKPRLNWFPFLFTWGISTRGISTRGRIPRAVNGDGRYSAEWPGLV